MRSYDKYRSTRFIQKTDVEKEVLVTIDKVTEENKAPEYQAEDVGYIIHFKEDFKPWGPGFETLSDIGRIAGTGDVDAWPGTELVLFVDPNVKFGPKKVGGIRCRAPKELPGNQSTGEPPAQQPSIEEMRRRVAEAEAAKAEAEKGDGIPY